LCIVLLCYNILIFIAFCCTMLAMKHDEARNFTFRLSRDVYASLSAIAKERGITLARLVRVALAEHLEGDLLRKGMHQ
jgi:Ribbon-helix-helix protein, copG family